MQVASVTGVVGVSFIVTLFASVANYVWEEGISKKTLKIAVGYEIFVVVLISIGMSTIEKIAASVENFNLLFEFYQQQRRTIKHLFEKSSRTSS